MEEKQITRIDDAGLPCQSEKRLDIAPFAESREEALRLLQELQVHQVELEMQNEELRQARNELEEAREKYTDLYEFAPVGYFTLDQAGSISSANLMGSSLFKIERSQLIGQRFANFLSVETRPAFADVLARVFTSLVKEACEAALENTLFVQIEALAAVSGQECRITLTDITELKKSSKRIRASEMRYRRLFESAKDGILILDAESGLIFDVNPYLCEILGFSSEDFFGKHLWEIGAFNDIAASKDAFRTLQEKEYICYDDLPLSTKDGRTVEVEFVSNVYMVDKTKVIQCNIRDITANKKLEAQLRHSQKMEAVGQLAGGIAHDFNNILSAIVGFGSLVQMNMAENDPSQDDMAQIIAAVDRAADLTKGLLAFSRKQVIQPAPVNLNEIILKVGKFLGRIIGEDIAFETTFKKETLTVNVDSGQIEQVLMNLATNARDAMPAGGTFSILTESVEIDQQFLDAYNFGAAGRYVCISVSDTGKGMAAATSARIFEPFFSTKDVGKGTGLGLPIVYGIVKQHNGFINVYSEPGIGTTFRIYLPLLLEEPLETGVPVPAPSAPLPGGTETILLAEDDAMILSLMKGFLTDFGYTVITAVDGEEAISKFTENKERIQLLLFDLIMPKKSGKAAYDEIKKSKNDVRAIFVSGYLSDVILAQGLQDEMCDLVMKPVSPQNLLRKIREVLDR